MSGGVVADERATLRRRARRWLRRGGPVLLALLLAAVLGAAVRFQTIPIDRLLVVQPDRLTVADDVPAEVRTGGLTVTVSGGTAPQLRIRVAGETVWESAPGTAFLTAGDGRVDVAEHRGYFWPKVRYDRRWTRQTLDSLRVEDGAVRMRGTISPAGFGAPVTWRAEVTRDGPRAVLEAETAGDTSSLGLWSSREDGAAVHGFGEQFTDFDLDGRLIPVLVREQGVGRGEQPITLLADLTNHGAGGTEAMTYAAWSSWVTEDLRGVRLDPELPASHAFAVGDTRTPGLVGLEVWADRLRAELTSADSPRQLVARQQAGTTRPPLAGWPQRGSIIGLQGGTEEVRRRLRALLEDGAAISGVWLQDWTGQRTTSFGDRVWWTWQLDEERYPGWDRLVEDLADEGIAVTTYVNPFLVDAGAKDPGMRNLWAEARRAGYLVEDSDGRPYALDQGDFDAYLVDLTDPEARDWYAGVIATEVLGEGVRGFMADFGEGLPFDAVLENGAPALQHNRWPLLWAQTVRAACEKAHQPRCVTWFRSGSLGMAAEAPLFWNGDQLVTFDRRDGLGSVLPATFSAGVSGWPLVHSDVGGYTSVDAVVKDYRRSRELLARWAELAAFGVAMRTHEGNRPDVNPQVSDPPSRARFARMTRVFAALAPYRRQVVRTAVRTGVPAIRHPWLVAPGTRAATVDTQFFLGPSVLVAPVLHAGADSVEVTFPPGRWRHLVTGTEYDGGRTTEVDAPIGRPAAFVRVGDPWAQRLTSAVRAALS